MRHTPGFYTTRKYRQVNGVGWCIYERLISRHRRPYNVSDGWQYMKSYARRNAEGVYRFVRAATSPAVEKCL